MSCSVGRHGSVLLESALVNWQIAWCGGGWRRVRRVLRCFPVTIPWCSACLLYTSPSPRD
eukprot:4127175-Alexandrium_andersonii.AAC.1